MFDLLNIGCCMALSASSQVLQPLLGFSPFISSVPPLFLLLLFVSFSSFSLMDSAPRLLLLLRFLLLLLLPLLLIPLGFVSFFSCFGFSPSAPSTSWFLQLRTASYSSSWFVSASSAFRLCQLLILILVLQVSSFVRLSNCQLRLHLPT